MQYLFRGKRKDNNIWVYGSLVNSLFELDKDKSAICYIIPDPKLNHNVPYYDCWEDIASWIDDYEVIPETIGQALGMIDNIGNTVFDGDILRGKFGTGLGLKSTKYKEFNYLVNRHPGDLSEHYLNMPKGYGNYRFCPRIDSSGVIGNIHDHPELLNG